MNFNISFNWGKGKSKSDPLIKLKNHNSALQRLLNFANFNTPRLGIDNMLKFIDEGYEKNSDLFAVVNWRAEKAAAIPLVVEQKKGDKWERVPEHDLQKLIDRPNTFQNGIEQRHLAFTYYSVSGNTFLYGTRLEEGRNIGQTQEMFILPSQAVAIKGGTLFTAPVGYKLSTSFGQDVNFIFTDVMHMRTPTLEYTNGLNHWGMSPLRPGLMSLERSNANYLASTSSFKNNGSVGILHEANKNTETPYSQEQKTDLEEDFSADYNGINTGRIYRTNADVVNFIKTMLSPVDLNLISDKTVTLGDFCRIYKIDPIVMGENENSSYANGQTAEKASYVNSVIPMVDRYIEEFTNWIVGSYGDDIRVVKDLSNVAVLQSDKKEQAERLNGLVDRGILTRNEARIEMGKDVSDVKEMDTHTVTFSTTPIEDISTDFMTTDAAEKALKALNIKHYGSK